jgi:uncharacterized protein with PIN domain
MEIRFIAEPALGKLAKWLRILGFDTLYIPDSTGGQLPKERLSDRVLLTRTRQVQRNYDSGRLLFVYSNDPVDQLREVIGAMNISKADVRPFSRCTLCNRPIETVKKDAIRNRVPDYVWQSETTFRQCRFCNKVYWPGSHAVRSQARINRLFENQ